MCDLVQTLRSDSRNRVYNAKQQKDHHFWSDVLAIKLCAANNMCKLCRSSIRGEAKKNLDPESRIKLDLVRVVSEIRVRQQYVLHCQIKRLELDRFPEMDQWMHHSKPGLLPSIQHEKSLDVKHEEYILQSVATGIGPLCAIVQSVRDLQANADVAGSALHTRVGDAS